MNKAEVEKLENEAKVKLFKQITRADELFNKLLNGIPPDNKVY